ncbi:MAG: hypothetical protein ACJAYC_003643 [Halieaceae bacterium]|jgi:hypothetical protein
MDHNRQLSLIYIPCAVWHYKKSGFFWGLPGFAHPELTNRIDLNALMLFYYINCQSNEFLRHLTRFRHDDLIHLNARHLG